jgi:hypothetical protein
MNQQILNNVKLEITKSLSSNNIFGNFITFCENYCGTPVHSIRELKTKQNTKLKGDIFEHFSYLYLVHVINMKDVWFVKDCPKEILTQLKLSNSDLGIDLISRDIDGLFYAIQVKYRKKGKKTNNVLSWKELSTFYALVSRSGPFHKHIIFTNADYTRHVGEKSIKDKSICFKTLENIKYEQWLKMCGNQGFNLLDTINSIKENILVNEFPKTINELRLRRLEYYDNLKTN